MRAEHRLRHNDDFRLTTRKGVRAARSHVMVHLAIVDSPEVPRVQREPRVGFVVSKKVGNSVIRHRVKRRLWGIMATRIGSLPDFGTIVIRMMPGAAEVAFADLEREVESALASALRKQSDRAR